MGLGFRTIFRLFALQALLCVPYVGQGRELATQYQTWCIAKTAVSPQGLQDALDWACSQGAVNCAATQTGGPCYLPDTLANHASWAFNSYYQKNGNAAGTCDFGGVAQVVTANPSYSGCVFAASNVTTSVNGTPPSGNSSPAFQLHTGTVAVSCLVTAFVLGLRRLEG